MQRMSQIVGIPSFRSKSSWRLELFGLSRQGLQNFELPRFRRVVGKAKIEMNSDQMLFFFSTLVGVAIGVVGTLLFFRHKSGQVVEALEASRKLTEALDTQISAMATRCGELEDQLVQSRAEEKKQRGLAELHLSKNAQFDEQTRRVWQIHRDYGLRAGNAQAWLFRELENAVRMINKYRAKENLNPIEVNPKLVNFLSEIKREPEENTFNEPKQ